MSEHPKIDPDADILDRLESKPLTIHLAGAAAEEIRRLRAAMEWQPIATAPKDGTWVRLWRGQCKLGKWNPEIIGRWFDFEEPNHFGVSAAWAWPDSPYDAFHTNGIAEANRDIERGDCFEDAKSFTHWKPLPEAPKDTP